MDDFVERLRSEHRLNEEPTGLTRKERKEWHKSKKQVGDAVVADFEKGLNAMIDANKPPKK